MGTTFSESYRARWVDMDFNQHMRNAAYLGCAEETRMRFMEAHGWSMAQFQDRQLGPVVVEDRLTYRRELRLAEPFRVDLQLAASTEDGRRIKVRSRFYRESDSELCAVVESVALWFDIAARRPVKPPADLKSAWDALEHAEDFTWF